MVPEPPDIVEADLGCDLDAGSWTLTLAVSGWAGRVRTWWTADGVYVEDHGVPATAYAEDGTGQEFQLDLSITPDFRLVLEGSATAHSCASNPSVLLSIDDLDGEPHDCLVFPGSDIDWSAIADVPSCPAG